MREKQMQIPLAFGGRRHSVVADGGCCGRPGRAFEPLRQLFAGQLDGKPVVPPMPAQSGTLLQQPTTPSAASSNAPRPMVACGMTLVPADPKLDARMLVPVPRNNAEPSIRTVTPTVCRS
jgi:hypothetical protein